MHIGPTRTPLTEHTVICSCHGTCRGCCSLLLSPWRTYCSLCRRTECSRRTLVLLAQLVRLGKIVCSFLSRDCRAEQERESQVEQVIAHVSRLTSRCLLLPNLSFSYTSPTAMKGFSGAKLSKECSTGEGAASLRGGKLKRK